MIRPGHAVLCFVLLAGVASCFSCFQERHGPDGSLPEASGGLSGPGGNPPGLEFVITVTAVQEGKTLLEAGARPGDMLEFGWIHSVEHFPWTDRKSVV